jgi:hypothetical protein
VGGGGQGGRVARGCGFRAVPRARGRRRRCRRRRRRARRAVAVHHCRATAPPGAAQQQARRRPLAQREARREHVVVVVSFESGARANEKMGGREGGFVPSLLPLPTRGIDARAGAARDQVARRRLGRDLVPSRSASACAERAGMALILTGRFVLSLLTKPNRGLRDRGGGTEGALTSEEGARDDGLRLWVVSGGV